MKFKNLARYRVGGTARDMKLAIPPPRTLSGRVYRFSPNIDAHPRHFVIGDGDIAFEPSDATRARMKLQPRSHQTVCPYSGQIADDADFAHPDDAKAAIEIVSHAAMADIHNAFSKMFKDFNRTSRFIKFEGHYAARRRPKPHFSRRDLLRELVCDHCSRDYGVYAIALYCPDCGAPNVRLHFAREAELVSAQVDLADGVDGDELAYRLLGNAHEDVLTAFEATLKAVYLHGMAVRRPDVPVKPVKNHFQNLDIATHRFKELDFDPFEHLSAADKTALALNIQIRHIIGHNLGVVDERFTAHAEHAKLGETVSLVGEDIRRFAAIAQSVIDRLDTWLVGSPSPFIDVKAVPSTQEGSPTPKEHALDLAQRIGVWIAKNSTDGGTTPVNHEALVAEFGESNETAMAIAELEADGLVTTTSYMGQSLPRIRPTVDLFFAFDALAIAGTPIEDTATLTEIVLAGPDDVNVAAVHAAIGWPLRRFNPPIALIIAEVDDRRVSKALNSTYPSQWFSLIPADRVALKALLKRVTQ
ncbi:hypothetical protein [Hyphomicrobium zavarzinii]|uniref:hypothetical protein n=1 Tax=Hyphomicrobium zavarzinii TaxID=48292 RepID=UPI0003740CB1|nr:hypothetical protein [Hyphomicrobium zavarzinii]